MARLVIARGRVFNTLTHSGTKNTLIQHVCIVPPCASSMLCRPELCIAQLQGALSPMTIIDMSRCNNFLVDGSVASYRISAFF